MTTLTTTCSAIFIATGEQIRVYSSVEEVPADLRDKLLESTSGMDSATILIADKGGREEILKALRRSQSERASRLVAALMAGKTAPGRARPRLRVALPILGRILLVGSLGYVLWTLATLR